MTIFDHTKLILAASLAFITAGCANAEEFSIHETGFDNPTCRAVATNRAIDAGITDDGIQPRVFRLTYASCMNWHGTRTQ